MLDVALRPLLAGLYSRHRSFVLILSEAVLVLVLDFYPIAGIVTVVGLRPLLGADPTYGCLM